MLQSDLECVTYFNLSEEEALAHEMPKISQLQRKVATPHAPSSYHRFLQQPTVMLENMESMESSPPPATPKKRKKVEGVQGGGAKSSSETPEPSTPQPKKKKGTAPTKQDKKKNVSPNKSKPRRSPSTDQLGCKEELVVDDEAGQPMEEDIECSAPQCIRPMANAINWVQCDLCQNWLHLVCVGLTNESVEKIESYSCFTCKQKVLLAKKQHHTASGDEVPMAADDAIV